MTTCPNGHPSQSTDYCDVCGTPIPVGAGPAGRTPVGSAAAPGPGPSAAPSTASSAAGSTAAAPTGPGGVTCPNCGVANLPDALFCEACGYDFTTGTMPRPASEEDDTPTNEQPAVGADGLPLAAPESHRTDAGADAPEVAADGVDGSAGAADVAGPAAVGTRVDWVAEIWVDPEWYRTQNSPDPLPSPGLPEVVALRDSSVLVGRASQSRNIAPQIDCGLDSGVSRRHAQLNTDSRRWWVEDLGSSNGTFVAPASGPLPGTPIEPGGRVELRPDDRVYVGGWTRLVIRRATEEEQATG